MNTPHKRSENCSLPGVGDKTDTHDTGRQQVKGSNHPDAESAGSHNKYTGRTEKVKKPPLMSQIEVIYKHIRVNTSRPGVLLALVIVCLAV